MTIFQPIVVDDLAVALCVWSNHQLDVHGFFAGVDRFSHGLNMFMNMFELIMFNPPGCGGNDDSDGTPAMGHHLSPARQRFGSHLACVGWRQLEGGPGRVSPS